MHMLNFKSECWPRRLSLNGRQMEICLGARQKLHGNWKFACGTSLIRGAYPFPRTQAKGNTCDHANFSAQETKYGKSYFIFHIALLLRLVKRKGYEGSYCNILDGLIVYLVNVANIIRNTGRCLTEIESVSVKQILFIANSHLFDASPISLSMH